MKTNWPAVLSACALLGLVITIASPAQGATLFWTQYRYDPGDPQGVFGEVFSVHRADTSDVPGTQLEVIHSLAFQPDYNSLSAHGGRVYVRRFLSNNIYSANFDGSGFGPDVSPSSQVGAELDGKLFDAAGVTSYIPNAAAGKIFRGDFEYENRTELISTPFFLPNMALALDEPRGNIYWAGGCNGCLLKVGRANLDGSGLESLPVGNIYYDDYPADIALDLTAGKIYWINESEFKIQRANLDGSGVEDVLIGILPFSLTLVPVPEPAAWQLAALGLAAIIAFVLVASSRRRSSAIRCPA